ncbi:MAG: TonB-dependent receptor, partial [Bacteroidota bacterium]
MNLKLIISSLFILGLQLAFSLKTDAQTILVSGKVIDAEKKEALVGVTVVVDNTTGTYSDLNGEWKLSLTEGAHQIKFSYIGWNDTTVNWTIKSGDGIPFIILSQKGNTLNEVVVGANRYSRPLAEQTVSMNILHTQELQNKNLQSGADALDQVPGVTVIDGQAGIRGGAGYAFGAGSRVLIIMDDQPLITADRNDVKWNFIPMENIDQIEIVKGASSVQYGSAALNGVVNVHTSFPTVTPELKLNLFFTRYDGSIPKNRLTDSSKIPFAMGGYFLQKRKIGKSDFVYDAYAHQSQSWLQGDWDKRIR